jgi:hypothetical protein
VWRIVVACLITVLLAVECYFSIDRIGHSLWLLIPMQLGFLALWCWVVWHYLLPRPAPDGGRRRNARTRR